MIEQNNSFEPAIATQTPASSAIYPLPTPDDDGRVRIYFADRELLFVQDKAPEGYYIVDGLDNDSISRAKIITFIEKYNKVAIVCDDIQRVFDLIAEQFVWVEAAGGIVKSGEEVVMIRRNERWDLPKGHQEEGEEPEECAAREVEEETGVKVATIDRWLSTTIHCYNLYGKWEMKQTVWYEMSAEQKSLLVPQREEGIVEAKWVPSAEIDEHIKKSFPTIKSVFKAFRE